MSQAFRHFGGIDFSGAREPLSNLWSAVGEERDGRLCITQLRPHAFRADLANYLLDAWRGGAGAAEAEGRIVWGVGFPLGLPSETCEVLGAGGSWQKLVAWVADRPPDEVRSAAGELGRTPRLADTSGAIPPLDSRQYKQTVEGMRWLAALLEEGEVSIHPQAVRPSAATTLLEVHTAGTAQELGLPRRRTPARPGEARARAAALRTFVGFADANLEALATTLEDAWDATIACITAYQCRDDLDQPFRASPGNEDRLRREGWIYRPPASLG